MSVRKQEVPLDMFAPWVNEEDEKYVLDALRNGWTGEKVYYYCEAFEREFAAWHDRKYALMTPNCTHAIHLLLAGLGVEEDDEVIVPETTWIASAAPVTYQRAKTVFADVDPVHWCLTPESVEARITERTRAIICVDVYGNMPDWNELQALADKHDIALIEDSAEALGSTYHNRRAGKLGVGSVFSFHRTKTMTTGEGGVLLLDDDDLYARCKLLRDHGRAPFTYFNVEVAFKYMPSNMQAALAYGQFKRVDELVGKKRWILEQYRQGLANVPDILLNYEPEHTINGAWCTTLVIGDSHDKNAEQLMTDLKEQGLVSRPFFFPLTSLPAYDRQDWGEANNPVAYSLAERGVVLPSGFQMTEKLIAEECAGIRKALGV